MSIKKIFILSLLLAFSSTYAQLFELGKVSMQELQEKTHPKDTSAAAAILFKKGKTAFEYSQNDGFVMETEVQTRIKIYKKSGYDWANQIVKYYADGSGSERVDFSDAITYNLVDGKIVKTKLKSDGEFDEKVNRYWSQKKITMPNVKEGSVIEFRYKIRTANFGLLKDWDFQTSIPVNYSEFRTHIPEYFTYKTTQKGYVYPRISYDNQTKTIVLVNKERTAATMTSSANVSYSNNSIIYKENRTIYIAEDLPAMKEEAFVSNIKNYTSILSNELSYIKYPNSDTKYFSTDWETVTSKIYDNDDFGFELKKTGYFEDDIKAVIAGLTSRDEKIAAIFNFVKSKVKWNGYYGYSCNDGVKTAYKNRTGNVAEINLMLTAMLRYAGVDANPVLISTRSNGIALFPSRNAFNYVISAVEIEEALILLDATEEYATPNVIPLRDINWNGRLIRKDGTSANVNLFPKSVSKEVVNMALSLKPDGTVNGKIRKQVSEQLALSFREKNIVKTTDAYLEDLENKNGNIQISDYVRENEKDLAKPIVETYSFTDTKGFDVIGDKLYISPLLFLTQSENPFKQEKREYPIDFGYPTQDKFNISIEIPEGYVVESMPAMMNIVTGDDLGAFKYIVGNTGNKIQISITADLNATIVTADYYEVLKDFFQKMIDKQNEKIVLKKA